MTATDFRQEAYRLINATLNRVREVLREALTGIHGPAWEDLLEPAERRQYLAQRRERELTLNWRRSGSDDLLQYASFADLYEILAADRRTFARFSRLARDEEVLRLRFKEMDAIFQRVAYARPISESELEFLVSFDERLRRLEEVPPEGRAAEVPPPPQKPAAPPAAPPQAAAPEPSPRGKGVKQAPPVPSAGGAQEPAPAAAAAASPGPPPAVSPSRLREALHSGDVATIFAALYGEVTAIADGLWSDTPCPAPRLWELVRESEWYSRNFTPLRLKPLSDFYELTASAREHLSSGMSRKQVQDFLKEHNFAQILLALRDLFRTRLAGAAAS